LCGPFPDVVVSSFFSFFPSPFAPLVIHETLLIAHFLTVVKRHSANKRENERYQRTTNRRDQYILFLNILFYLICLCPQTEEARQMVRAALRAWTEGLPLLTSTSYFTNAGVLFSETKSSSYKFVATTRKK
jgi:hypothetical protein